MNCPIFYPQRPFEHFNLTLISNSIMSEPNPWDQLPSVSKPKLKEPREAPSQVSLFNRFKSKLLSSDTKIAELPNATKCRFSLLSKLNVENSSENNNNVPLPALPCVVSVVSSEFKENIPLHRSFSEITGAVDSKLMKTGKLKPFIKYFI